MAEKNKPKLTPFQQEIAEVKTKVLEYKLAAEANIVSTLYKIPEELYNLNISLNNFSNNVWRVYFEILRDIVLDEKKSEVDAMTISLYLKEHSKLRDKYYEYGGYDTIEAAMEYVKEKNLEGWISTLRKWDSVVRMCELGFPVKDRLSDYTDMSEEEIYDEHEAHLNHIFVNVSSEVKSYNAFDGIDTLIDEMDSGEEVGLPFYNAPLLTGRTGGFNLDGNIYGLGAGSGVGKSTMAFNYIIPSAIQYGEKCVFIINEEDERKLRKELIVWVANNVFKEELQKHTLRDGKFNTDTMDLLRRCAKWIQDKKDEHILTVIPLERYSVSTVTKIIKKYNSAWGVRVFCLDTLKESFDAKTDEIYKSMMRDMVTLYDVVKPSAKNVGLFVTYQLGKSSLKMRYLTNNEIGQAKSIIDVMSVNIMMRRPYDDEYEGGDREPKCFKYANKNSKTQIPIHMREEDHNMITFITKNRFGETGGLQIVSKCDLSRNVYEDIGFCSVPQDF